MKLPLREPHQAKYLHLDSKNTLHILMPVVSGTSIGLDNTCKAVSSLQEFFGKGSHSNQQATLKGELLAYKEALESDLLLLEAKAPLAQQKKERLAQINVYLDVVMQLENHAELTCLNQNFPSYPEPLEAIMRDRTTSNLYSMVLRPANEDGYLRSEAANPVFSVAHESAARNRGTTISPLQEALISAYAPLHYEPNDLKSQVIQQVLTQLAQPHVPVNFIQLRDLLTKSVQALLKTSVDFTQTQEGKPLTQSDIDTTMEFTVETPPKDYIDALLGFCAPNLFDDKVESPFNTLTDAEGWSIATQFLLGIANIHAVSQKKVGPGTNFGQILDGNETLSQALAKTLAEAQKNNACIEDAALSWMNAQARKLQRAPFFDSDDVETIKKTFATLYAQLKKERPDFKPQIDTKQFLQHVAYGEQNEAEALLQKDPELAQVLLKANKIPFTDYSGRTFTCTAYEYAYWAKDTHMQRMLEKYITQDETTRQLILTRVQAIEELVEAPGFFEWPRPRGLRYTTQDKEGKTITHRETHFDLRPLKDALKHYAEEYDKRPNESDDDRAELEKILIEKVGRAQRDVPAHIAQEYCHPNRSFDDVNKDKDNVLLDARNPANLERHLNFYNIETCEEGGWWLTPICSSIDSGLGFSFSGILRGGAPMACDGKVLGRFITDMLLGPIARRDSIALEAIDEVRTKDLKQSLGNLSQPPAVQSSQSHGI